MEEHAAKDNILEMIEMLVELKLYVKGILNAHLHLHLSLFLGLFDIAVVMQDCEIDLLYNCGLEVAVHDCADEVADSACDPVECLILLLEVRELELEGFCFGQDASRLELLGKRVELG